MLLLVVERRPMVQSFSPVLSALGIFTLVGCLGAGDIFVPSRDIVAGYRLQEFESGLAYYLCRPDGGCGGGGTGLLDGAVLKLGWSKTRILLYMNGPAPEGWRVVDVQRSSVQGPLADSEMEMLRKSDPALQDISVQPVKEVWAHL